MAESVDRTELAAFRAYVEKHREDVLEMVLRGAPSLRYMTPYAGVTGELVLEWDDILDLIKPWSCDFAPDANTLKRYPVRIKSIFQKAELQFCPKQDFFTYKGYLVRTKQNAKDYPYARWAMEKAATKIKTQQEFQQLFTGTQVGSPTNAAGILDGLLTLITDDQALGTPLLTPVATGALVSATVVDQIEQMDDAINEEYRTVDMRMYCSPTVFKLYRRKYRSLAGFHPDNDDTDTANEIMIDGSTTILTSCPGMGTSQRLILTPQSNVYYAYDGESDNEVFEMEQDHRNLDVWCDYWFGVGFLIFDPRILDINDQA